MDLLDLPVPPQPHPYLAQMARFSDGEAHRVRRAALLEVLPSADDLARLAADRCRELPDRFDVMPLLRRVPVVALCAAMGLADLSAEVAALCDRGEVSTGLPGAARTSLLFQCRDATAALVVGRLLGRSGPTVRITRRVLDGEVVDVPLDDAPYGRGRHACPGREHAVAIADGICSTLRDHRVVAVGPDEGRLNMRLPTTLEVSR